MSDPPVIDRSHGHARAATLPARPEALRLSAADTAVVVIDMQNAYASAEGYLDLAGFDIAGVEP